MTLFSLMFSLSLALWGQTTDGTAVATAKPAGVPTVTAAAPKPVSAAPAANTQAPSSETKNVAAEITPSVPVKSKTFTPFGTFGFGSYGRVNLGTNMDGEPIYPVNITAHGPRLEESTYVELDLYYLFKPYMGVKTKTVATLALSDSLFHYNGEWTTSMAIRNLYLEFSQESLKGFSFWVGSRMYRGDDIYLLDYWPLDNLNTLGAGIWYDVKPIRAGLHIGTNRVLGPYQYQEATVATPFVGSQTIPTLNRQRNIASFKLEYWKQLPDSIGFKVKGYGEFHSLPSGTYNALGEPEEQIQLPSETGVVAGLQVGLWNFAPKSFINLFVRYGQGIGAYGEFSQPQGIGYSQDLDTSYSVTSARDLVIALSGNYLIPKRFGVMFGAYYRKFTDADGLSYDWDDGYEIVAAVRPHLWIPEILGDNVALAAELSYQSTERSGLHPESQTAIHPSVWKFSFIPTWIAGTNTYSRPAVRLVYTMAKPNEDARLWYNQHDYRRVRQVEHFVGIQAEWWFNSSTYQ
ncbi:carbohydrate porin [Myxococcota bacterium]|nr:carbohydrate porin [Myxococcota bacterium]MBU1534007.1 carbohydrate porin [Myxococcota bacterium]